MKTLTFVNKSTGVEWLVKLVENGDCYGLNNCLTNEGETLVEFYWAEGGTFCTRYYASTIQGIAENTGLMMDGSNYRCNLDADKVNQIKEWLGEQ